MKKLPRRVVVRQVLSSRYQPGERPLSWDERYPGVETIETIEGETIQLYSNGGQSSPAPGWEILLTKTIPLSLAFGAPKAAKGSFAGETEESSEAIEEAASEWTLYGIAHSLKESADLNANC